MFIEVLYSNLKRKKVSLDAIDSLPKDNVLFIAVTNSLESGKKANITTCFGFDHYAFCQKTHMGSTWVLLFGWDDGDYKWRRLLNPHESGSIEQVNPPLGCMHVVFDGVHVDDSRWKSALDDFHKEMT